VAQLEPRIFRFGAQRRASRAAEPAIQDGAAMNLRALRTPIAPAGAVRRAKVPASADLALGLIQHHGCMSLCNRSKGSKTLREWLGVPA
jgi:hypothetical protein